MKRYDLRQNYPDGSYNWIGPMQTLDEANERALSLAMGDNTVSSVEIYNSNTLVAIVRKEKFKKAGRGKK